MPVLFLRCRQRRQSGWQCRHIVSTVHQVDRAGESSFAKDAVVVELAKPPWDASQLKKKNRLE